jgi:hypothetical protein
MLTIVHIKKELSILYLGQKEKKNCHGRNGGGNFAANLACNPKP